jgi:hypothetical protein
MAVAAAGGDEQALRATFIDTGAAVLLQDGAQLYCFSARVQCQNLPSAPTGARRGLAQLQALTPGVGVDFPASVPAPAPVLSRPQGSLALEQGWTVSWQMPQGDQGGVLYPAVVLTQVASSAPSTPAVATAAQTPPTPAAPTTAARVVCERGADSRTIWLAPGDPKAGYVCRTLYQVGETQAVLWNALQNPEVCAAKAEARVERDVAQGFKCRKVAVP